MDDYFVLEYLYRDADNFKAYGGILLTGNVAENYVSQIESLLESGEYFVAEQVGIPVLYSGLWKFSNGPTSADHAFHEFIKIRHAVDSEIKTIEYWGTTTSLLDAFRKVSKKWDCLLSVHCSGH